MARVTSTEVFAIIDSTYTGITATTDLDPFIGVSTVIVDDNLVSAGLSTESLKNVELYLSAHFSVLKYRQPLETEISQSMDDFANPLKTGFYQTIYGQQAMTIDSSGTLSDMSKENSFSSDFGVLEGTKEWTNY